MFAGQKILLKQGDPCGPKKRIAVIGCGVAGLVSMKTALEYGHDVVGFERLHDIGGIWNFKCCGTPDAYADIPDPEVHCYPTYDSLLTNTSAYMTSFSDFLPLNPDRHEFLKHTEICAYLKAYADHFNLLPKVRLQTEVQRLDKQNNKWRVQYKEGDDMKVEEFDFVMICIGAFGYPHLQPMEGEEQFQGVMIHSGQVRNGGPAFRDKRALVIGGAYSGGEMLAMALANGAKKVYVSATHRPESRNVWSIDRYTASIYGDRRPWDYSMNRENALVNPADFGSMLSQWCYPFHKSTEDAVLKYPGDALALADMKQVVKGQTNGVLEFVEPVVKFGQKSAHLRNGSQLSDLDVVVRATGYDQKFPFLNHVWPRSEQIKCELYNYTMSPREQLDGLAFILATPSGFPLFHSAEMQTRWFVQRIASRSYDGKGSLFDEEERKHMNDTIAQKYKSREGIKIRFNYIDSMHQLIDTLAKDIGVNAPDYKELVATGDERNAELGVALAYGPLSGLQYRIQGPHAWSQAGDECIAFAKKFLGTHFEEYLTRAKANIYPRSGLLDSKKGPHNQY